MRMLAGAKPMDVTYDVYMKTEEGKLDAQSKITEAAFFTKVSQKSGLPAQSVQDYINNDDFLPIEAGTNPGVDNNTPESGQMNNDGKSHNGEQPLEENPGGNNDDNSGGGSTGIIIAV